VAPWHTIVAMIPDRCPRCGSADRTTTQFTAGSAEIAQWSLEVICGGCRKIIKPSFSMWDVDAGKWIVMALSEFRARNMK